MNGAIMAVDAIVILVGVFGATKFGGGSAGLFASAVLFAAFSAGIAFSKMMLGVA